MDTLILLFSLTWPHYGPVTQTPSYRHPAVDIACSVGDPIRAAHSGRLHRRWDADLGNVIEIHGNEYHSLYAHLDTVMAAGEVEQGQIIAACGNTGRLTTGPHLHLSIESLQKV